MTEGPWDYNTQKKTVAILFLHVAKTMPQVPILQKDFQFCKKISNSATVIENCFEAIHNIIWVGLSYQWETLVSTAF